MIKWFDKTKLPGIDTKISFTITKRKRKQNTDDEEGDVE